MLCAPVRGMTAGRVSRALAILIAINSNTLIVPSERAPPYVSFRSLRTCLQIVLRMIEAW